jgi:hypothetical protein
LKLFEEAVSRRTAARHARTERTSAAIEAAAGANSPMAPAAAAGDATSDVDPATVATSTRALMHAAVTCDHQTEAADDYAPTRTSLSCTLCMPALLPARARVQLAAGGPGASCVFTVHCGRVCVGTVGGTM